MDAPQRRLLRRLRPAVGVVAVGRRGGAVVEEGGGVVRAKAGLFFFGSPLPEAIEIAAAYGGSGEAAN